MRLRLCDAVGQEQELDRLLSSGVPASARERQPHLLWVIVGPACPELSDKALLSTAVVNLTLASSDDPVEAMREHGAAMLKDLSETVRVLPSSWQSWATPFDPEGWGRDCAAFLPEASFQEARWVDRRDQQERIELFWLGSLNANEALEPGRWTALADDCELLDGSVFSDEKGPDPEAVDRMNDLLERNKGKCAPGKGGLMFKLSRVGRRRYRFDHVDPLDAL